jgi:ATP-dependent RNA helicase DeaD
MLTFESLGLNAHILQALGDLGFSQPTEIQQKAIPFVISNTNDLKAFAQTGTGKTAAFSLPVLEMMDTDSKSTQCLILSPTRELAVQIGKNIEDFSKYMSDVKTTTVYGGSDIEKQIRKLKKGSQIVVGTPGRTLDLINRGVLKVDQLRWMVLDEADEMLNMGFKDELDKILANTPKKKQTLLFSATFPKEVEDIAKNYMTKPHAISAGTKNTGSDHVSNEYFIVKDHNRYEALKRYADMHPSIYGIIFCRTKREAQDIADKLIFDGYNADSLHGDLGQNQRDAVMDKFRKKGIQLLVATDVAARGLDVDNLSHVINYRLPEQPETYTHRSGRTGRAGNDGICLSIINKKEISKLKPIEKRIKQEFKQIEVPTGDEICKAQLFDLIRRVKENEVDDEQIAPFIDDIMDSLEEFDRVNLIKRFISLEFNRFLSYYKNSNDINDRRKGNASDDMTRFFINLGKLDKLTPPRLLGLINEKHNSKDIEIGAIDIFDKFSFFEIDKNFANATLEVFKDSEFEGRKIGVEVTHSPKPSGNKSKKSRRFRDQVRSSHRKSRRGKGAPGKRGRR